MRDKIEAKYKWNLEDIITEIEWNEIYPKLESEIYKFDSYRGKLGDKNALYELLKLMGSFEDDIMRVYAYAKMKHDENTMLAKYSSMSDRAERLYVKYSTAVSFVLPELTALSENYLSELIADEKFSEHDYYFKTIIRQKKHILSDKEEAILSNVSEITGGFSDVFEMLDNADLNLPKLDIEGESVQLSHANYALYMQSDDRETRKKVFEAYYTAYKKVLHTIATAYNFNVKKDWFFAKTRGYLSCMEKAMAGEDVDKKVYENLISSVRENIGSLHEYIDYKKKALGYDKFYMYDMYVPTIAGSELKLGYDDAYKVVKEGLAVLGEEYGQLLTEAYDKNWIDVYETEGKRSGAYSFGVRTCHPYVLLNYEKTTHNIFTIAHELGHAMHSYYSNKTQPQAKSDYVIFVAEVASTVNEVLLLRHIAKNAKDKALKRYLLYYFLEMFRTTMFRQTQFAEFESISHEMAEKGEPLTHENLSEVYEKLNFKYYGEAIEKDDFIKYEWSRIPHFYRAFYVYKYATGIISAVNIADRIMSGETDALANYKKFLCSGGSDSPTELLKIAGVDLMTKQPFENAMKVFADTLKQLKESK